MRKLSESCRSAHKILISSEQERLRISPHIKLLVKRAVNMTLYHELFDGITEVSVTFVDDERIKELNNQFRHKDASTDVLSFPLDESDALGDIVISTDHAIAQAEEYGHSLDREIAFLTVHSTLHLLGYDHERSKDEEEEMFGIQKEVMELLGLERNGKRF